MLKHIFFKEIKDTLRDRRTIIAMIVVPILVFPLILFLITSISKSFTEAAKEKTLKIAVRSDEGANYLTKLVDEAPTELGKREIEFISEIESHQELIEEEKADVIIDFNSDFDKNEEQFIQNEVIVYYSETNLSVKQKVTSLIEYVNSNLLQERLIKKEIDRDLLEPLKVEYVNLASDKEMLGKVAGGFLPYLFIIFGFIGCMYPAIDLFTGEKERKTLETLLTTPVPRWLILIGKMGVVALSGILAASFALIGLFLAIEVLGFDDNQELISVVRSILNVKFILLLYLLLIPLCIFFAALLIPITVRAKTFKEAQSIITPLNFAVILPAMIGFIPDIEIDFFTSLIPIVNTVLLTKELIAETYNFSYILMTFLSTLVFASIAVIVSFKAFGKESHIISS